MTSEGPSILLTMTEIHQHISTPELHTHQMYSTLNWIPLVTKRLPLYQLIVHYVLKKGWYNKVVQVKAKVFHLLWKCIILHLKLRSIDQFMFSPQITPLSKLQRKPAREENSEKKEYKTHMKKNIQVKLNQFQRLLSLRFSFLTRTYDVWRSHRVLLSDYTCLREFFFNINSKRLNYSLKLRIITERMKIKKCFKLNMF